MLARFSHALPAPVRRCSLAEIQSWNVGWGHRRQDGSRPFVGAKYRIPTLDQVLEEFPMTPNRKIDRNRLPIPTVDRSGIQSELVPPQTPSEQVLWNIFSSAFDTDQIGIRDNFF